VVSKKLLVLVDRQNAFCSVYTSIWMFLANSDQNFHD
jgi:hypothetical protein